METGRKRDKHDQYNGLVSMATIPSGVHPFSIYQAKSSSLSLISLSISFAVMKASLAKAALTWFLNNSISIYFLGLFDAMMRVPVFLT